MVMATISATVDVKVAEFIEYEAINRDLRRSEMIRKILNEWYILVKSQCDNDGVN